MLRAARPRSYILACST